jgi:hypothetical protein
MPSRGSRRLKMPSLRVLLCRSSHVDQQRHLGARTEESRVRALPKVITALMYRALQLPLTLAEVPLLIDV